MEVISRTCVIHMQDATELFRGCDFKAFASVVESGSVLTIAAKGVQVNLEIL